MVYPSAAEAMYQGLLSRYLHKEDSASQGPSYTPKFQIRRHNAANSNDLRWRNEHTAPRDTQRARLEEAPESAAWLSLGI